MYTSRMRYSWSMVLILGTEKHKNTVPAPRIKPDTSKCRETLVADASPPLEGQTCVRRADVRRARWCACGEVAYLTEKSRKVDGCFGHHADVVRCGYSLGYL